MAEINPPWEWRSFGRRFGPTEPQSAQLAASDPQESDERYLLCATGANVKLRDALMNIKLLREVNADGLEQWAPVMKASFPIAATEMTTVRQALGLPQPGSLRDAVTQEELFAQFSAPDSPVRVVPVRKRRLRYTVGGCHADPYAPAPISLRRLTHGR
jgi:exopolyphosphatase/guanosine-5'-triphosphate,3'-diphosphate pyrophosphatase